MILPIQRIPRYELLIKDLLKNTWKSHPDYSGLQEALANVKDAAVKLNRAKAFSESRKKIMTLKGFQSQGSGSMGGSGSSLLSPMSQISPVYMSSNSNLSPVVDASTEMEERYIGEGVLVYQEISSDALLASSRAVENAALDIDSVLSGSNESLEGAVDVLTGLKTLANVQNDSATKGMTSELSS